jgi:hypothetical protein
MRGIPCRKAARSAAIALFALAVPSGTLALAGDGDGLGAGLAAKQNALVDVTLATNSQVDILKARALELRVESDEAVEVKLRGISQIAGETKPQKVSKKRKLGLDAGGDATVKLPLTAKGRERLARCDQQELVVKVRATLAGDPFGDDDDGLGRVAEQLLTDGPACPTPQPASQPNPGDGSGGAEEPIADSPESTGRCDPLDPSVCLYPWPNDYFTVADPSTDTGRRLNLDPASMPKNRSGVPINPADYNRNDGFSPGQLIVTKVPGLESQEAFDQTGAVPITDVSQSFDPNQPIVVLNADTGERHLIWSEIDANPEDPEDVTLLIRPAVNFNEGGHYIVALRNLKDANGNPIDAQEPFRIYRDAIPTSDPDVEARRDHFEKIFGTLAGAGIERESLYLAWDFTVASRDNLSERMLHIRDDAFAGLGDTDLADLQVEGDAPPFTITRTTDYAPCGGDGCAEPDPITGQGGKTTTSRTRWRASSRSRATSTPPDARPARDSRSAPPPTRSPTRSRATPPTRPSPA